MTCPHGARRIYLLNILLPHRVGRQDHSIYGYMEAVQGCLVYAIRQYVPEGS